MNKYKKKKISSKIDALKINSGAKIMHKIILLGIILQIGERYTILIFSNKMFFPE